MRSSRPVLLLIGHAGIPTGFARVLQAIANHLAGDFCVHWLGINLPNMPSAQAAYTLHPNPGSLHDPEALIALARDLHPDVCLVLDEPWVCAARVATLRSLSPSPRVLCYCAADEPQLLPAKILPALALADHLIAFTNAARNLLTNAFREAEIPPPPVSTIPHGVDTTTFRPMSRLQSRRAIFPGNSDLDDSFIVLNANRNQPFKRIDLTLEGFALFAQNKPPSVKLCLHMASRPLAPRETPWVDRLGIRERMLFAVPPGRSHPHMDDTQLNLLYNACDAGINTADKEGWGLVSFEHAATGEPQVMADLPALHELWQDAAILLPTRPGFSNQIPGRVAPVVAPEDVAAALDLLYRDADARARWSAAALENAHAGKYRWETIAAQWRELIEDYVERLEQLRGS